jgi:LPS-assembly protein
LTVSDFGTGFRAGQEVGFFIRLKAIPFDSNFGRGRLGQALGSGTGRDF